MEFKHQLKKIRKEKGYTQKQLGIFLNCGSTAISNYEQGRTEPSLDIIKKLSEVFNVSIDYLLGAPYCNQSKVSDDFLEMYEFFSMLNKNDKETLILALKFIVDNKD